jgi:serine/threonine protein kinase
MILSESIVDNRFKIIEPFKHIGGMGAIHIVEDLDKEFNDKIIMKRSQDPENIPRFKKEIKIMSRLSDSPKIAEILHFNLESDTPYYIMKFYKNGSLRDFYKPNRLKNDFELQKQVFLEMIEAIQVLHDKNTFHRDIKPDNFLIDDDKNIIVTDFGLSVDLNSKSTRITKTEMYGYTEGYKPPEFTSEYGAFKYYDVRSDIYMLGKSFYALLTGDYNPSHVDKKKIDNFFYYIIDKSCQIEKENRYRDLKALKQDLLKKINYKLIEKNPYEKVNELCKIDFLNPTEIMDIYKLFSLLNGEEKKGIVKCLPLSLFEEAIKNYEIDLKEIIEVYKDIVEHDKPLDNWRIYPMDFMDRFRASMKKILDASYYKDEEVKAISLYLLVMISGQRGEYDCQDILKHVDGVFVDSAITLLISQNFEKNFLKDINIIDCKSTSIRTWLNNTIVE